MISITNSSYISTTSQNATKLFGEKLEKLRVKIIPNNPDYDFNIEKYSTVASFIENLKLNLVWEEAVSKMIYSNNYIIDGQQYEFKCKLDPLDTLPKKGCEKLTTALNQAEFDIRFREYNTTKEELRSPLLNEITKEFLESYKLKNLKEIKKYYADLEEQIESAEIPQYYSQIDNEIINKLFDELEAKIIYRAKEVLENNYNKNHDEIDSASIVNRHLFMENKLYCNYLLGKFDALRNPF